MRAVELRIVFEDDDGKLYTETHEGFTAEVAFRDLSVGEMERQKCVNERTLGTRCLVQRIGPVLRRVTEIEWIIDHDGDCRYINGNGEWAYLSDFVAVLPRLPKEIDPDSTPTRFRFRFDVMAVPVPEVEP